MASNQPSWPCLSGLSILHHDFTGNEGGAVAIRALQEPASAAGKIVGHLRSVELDLLRVDDIHIRFVPGSQNASVEESVELRCMLGHAVNGLLQGDARSA